MGGVVSSGESNDDLIDHLLESNYITSRSVERVFRAVDRALYYADGHKANAYRDIAWREGNLHLSAPCIYSKVMENLILEPGMSFLNMGSGTGYLSTMCGLVLGIHGINHGIELYPEVVDYARLKVKEFVETSPAIDLFDFCSPEFVVGNCLELSPGIGVNQYDRIYCGAACPETYVKNITDLLKIGGICVIPIHDSLIQITRVSEDKLERENLLSVSFANLIVPRFGAVEKKPVTLPEWKPSKLKDLCRSQIRSVLRPTFVPPKDERRKKRRRRRQERRRAGSRLVVVQRRNSGVEHNENGFMAVAYSINNHSSGDENSQYDREADNHAREENNESRNVVYSDDENEEMHVDFRASNDSDSEDDDELELANNDDPMYEPEQPSVPPVSNSSDIATGSINPGGSSATSFINNGSSSLPVTNADQPSNSNNSGEAAPSGTNGPVRNRGGVTINRTRNVRDQGRRAQIVFQQVRDLLLRHREYRDSSVSNTERLLQRISPRRIRQLAATASVGLFGDRSAATSDRDESQLGMEEERSSTSATRPVTAAATSSTSGAGTSNPRSSDNAGVRASRRNRNEDSCLWSTDSSLDDSSSLSSDSSDDDANHRDSSINTAGGRENHRVSTESGVATDTERKTEGEINESSDKRAKAENKKEGQENSSEPKSKKHPVSVEMQFKIKELPLPPLIKMYLNFYRPLE